MRNSTIVYRSKWNMYLNSTFRLKMMVKSGLRIILNSFMQKAFLGKFFLLHRRRIFAQNFKFSKKNKLLCLWRDFKKNFLMYVNIINETLSHKFHPYSILTVLNRTVLSNQTSSKLHTLYCWNLHYLAVPLPKCQTQP